MSHHHQHPRAQPGAESTVPVNAQVFEDNFNVLSQIINNYPTTNYTEGLTGSETDSSLGGTNSQEHEKKPLTDSFRYYLLILFSSIYLIYGCQNSLLGPAMSDLARLLNTTSENISVALSTKNFIFSISTILVSFSFKIFGNRQLQYGGAVITVGIITALTPHMTSFTQYLCCAVFSGFSSAFIDSVTNLVVLELWSLNSKVYMQIAHGAFTVGTIFGPLLVGPFLSKTDNSTIPSNGTTNDTTTTPSFGLFDLNESTTALPLDDGPLDDQLAFDSRIYVPYSIVACLLVVAAITMMISQILHPYVPEKRKLFAKQKSKKIVEPMEEQIENSQASVSSPESSQSSSANRSQHNQSSASHKKPKVETVCQQINLPKAYYRTFLGMTGVLLSIYSCVDGLTGMFMPSFLAKGELKIEKDEAAFMSSVVYMSMATGRLFTIIFALRTTCKILLFFNLSMTLLGYITLTFFAVHSKFITWISMFVIGGGLSSTYPLILSYIENRVVITNTVQLYLLSVGVLLLLFIPIIVGHFIDTAPMMFAYINVTLAATALLLMLGIHATDMWKKSLIKKIKEDQDILVHEEEE